MEHFNYGKLKLKNASLTLTRIYSYTSSTFTIFDVFYVCAMINVYM